ncbi:MAG: DUF1467 family protein [Holosporales bacterium]
MGVVSAIVVFLIIWWVLIFAVLPFGVEEEEKAIIGLADGAPKDAKIFKKIAVTTALTCLIWGVIYYGSHAGWFAWLL